MEIQQFEPSMAADVARCYNETVREVPFCHPVPAEAFASLEDLANVTCCGDTMLVAREADGEVVGFVHAAVAPPPTAPWHMKDEPGLTRFLAYPPGKRAAGLALLEAAENWARERQRSKLLIFDARNVYAFYHLPYAHLSERMPHVLALLGKAGYAEHWGELFLTWPDFHPPAAGRPGLDFELTLEYKDQALDYHKKVSPGIVVQAKQGEQKLGECIIARRGGPFRSPEELADWCYCHELNVEEPFQGRGLGKFLLATALAYMKDAGLRHALISTQCSNYRAALCYTNLGFRFLDRTLSLSKQL